MAYLVIRLIPTTPVDGPTFSTYLEDLTIQVEQADPPAGTQPLVLGGIKTPAAPITLVPMPGGGPNDLQGVVARPTFAPTNGSNGDFGKTLQFTNTSGIGVGAFLFNANGEAFTNSPATVSSITKASVELNQTISKFVPAGTVCSFAFEYKNNVTITPSSGPDSPPRMSFSVKTSADAAKDTNKLTFDSGKTQGIFTGMFVTGDSAIPDNTKVDAADDTSVTLSANLNDLLKKDSTIVFDATLPWGISQHLRPTKLTPDGWWPALFLYTPAAVATAVIELDKLPNPPPAFLNITVDATRTVQGVAETIPVNNDFYNVTWIADAPPADPSQYPYIPNQDVALYVSLPPPPTSKAIDVTVPADGSPPRFWKLYTAMTQVDPTLTPATMRGLSVKQCRLLAYEIIWSQRNALPPPSDPLEDLYTNPPNSGSASGGGSGGNDEQDRQRFEGTLSSFYATHNAAAEHLTKFVAAVAAAVWAEMKSLNADQPVLFRFPVDPDSSNANVISEVVLTGLPPNDPGGVSFGVPAAFFYALGANMSKSTRPDRRYQIATGDTLVRVLQEIGAAVAGGVLDNDASPPIADPDTQPFVSMPAAAPVSAAKAARRLECLGVSAASSTTKVAIPSPVPASGSFVNVVLAWLATPDPVKVPSPSYQNYHPDMDADIWKKIAVDHPQDYLNLDLIALTQNYVNPDTNQPLTTTITGKFALITIADLIKVTKSQWTDFFTLKDLTQSFHLLPPFTQAGTPTSVPPAKLQAGYIAGRIQAFVRAVQRFFTVSSAPNDAQPPNPGAPATFGPMPFDAIGQAVNSYSKSDPGKFVFGAGTDPLDAAKLTAAVQDVFPDDTAAQRWLWEAMQVINQLMQIASVVPDPADPKDFLRFPSLKFSVVEALYARGFRSANDIAILAGDDFQHALIGTVAYAFAQTPPDNSLYKRAKDLATVSPPAVGNSGPFRPINDGTLINCVPPPCLSPLGRIEYLKELLLLRLDATCETVDSPAQGETVSPTLGSLIADRRGPLGTLLASCANLETPLPVIDIVNENLESLAATAPETVSGVVYNTAADKLGDHRLCQGDEKPADGGHDPALLFGAVPQYSTPAVPAQVPAGYVALRSDFSAPGLPYSQPIDVARSYHRLFCMCRFDTMRSFRRYISEFILDPVLAPPIFQAHLWRYPVHIDLAVEYVGLTPEEYVLLFTSQKCEEPWKLFGYPEENVGGSDTRDGLPWTTVIAKLGTFLERTGLDYCEFLDLVASGFATMHVAGSDAATFPACPPCCPDHVIITFGTDVESKQLVLCRLAVFIRLWRRLKESCAGGVSFAELADIYAVLGLKGGGLNGEFVRQLAALLMLRDHFRLPLSDERHREAGNTGADRTHLLALWVGPTAKKWPWALRQLLDRVDEQACLHHKVPQRPERLKVIADNLDPLSELAGFARQPETSTWAARPTSTLRFAEVLAKIVASEFEVGDLLFLFTADAHLDGEDPFPEQDVNEALDFPLGRLGPEHPHSLWTLREKLLCAEISDEEVEHWNWRRIAAAMRDEFGYVPPAGPDPLLSIGQHFFPHVLESHGQTVSAQQRQYRTSLADSTASSWNVPIGGPFEYDAPPAGELWTTIPLRDEAVIAKLGHMRQLTAAEQLAVQNLYFLPRLDLAWFSFMFPDFRAAERALIEEHDPHRRWAYFRHCFALAHKRCRIIAMHLSSHVRHRTGRPHDEDEERAWCVLRNLWADENPATSPWESDDGTLPKPAWTPLPNGGAFQALLGLIGTGLLAEFTADGKTPRWREMSGRLDVFGRHRNESNTPLPTVFPAMSLPPPAGQGSVVTLKNGYASTDSDGCLLGGAEGFCVRWSGILLVEQPGEYTFHAGAPAGDGERPERECGDDREWRITMARGSKTWLLLRRGWSEEREPETARLPLKRGAWHLTIEFRQPAPDLSSEQKLHPLRTGLQLAYAGPDTKDCLIPVPHCRLFRETVDSRLDTGIFPSADIMPVAGQFLETLFPGSLRDIRRTYQRAFKATLFAERLGLSARPLAEAEQSELGYILANSHLFAGTSYYQPAGSFVAHAVDFDFNFLPLRDDYLPPSPDKDQRVKPDPWQVQALFDWWERLFDYTVMRRDAATARARPAWLLFYEAQLAPPDLGHALRHIGVGASHAAAVLSYFDTAGGGSVFQPTASDLQDDRWAVRVWHAEQWVRALLRRFMPCNIPAALPWLWAADDPSVVLTPPGQSGNTNLTTIVGDGFLEAGPPRRYGDLQRVNNGLRERGRAALVAYLCAQDRIFVPGQSTAVSARDLSDLLLMDVETGLCERTSRIEEAITAVHNIVRLARLGRVAQWTVTRAFVTVWDRRFATFHVWQACRRRQIYRENWIEWGELETARRTEAFRLLESELRASSLSVAIPDAFEWWSNERPPAHPGLTPLETRQPSVLRLLPEADPAATPPPTPEGFAVMGTPERDARPSWLAILGPSALGSGPVSADGSAPRSPRNVIRQSLAQQPGEGQTGDGPPDPPTELPFWLEAAVRLGTRFIRVAAAGLPKASPGLDLWAEGAHGACCAECGRVHPAAVDEYYFWLVDTEYYDPNDTVNHDPTDPEKGIPGSYQKGIQESYYDEVQQQSLVWDDETLVPGHMNWASQAAVRLAWCRIHNGVFGQRRLSTDYVPVTATVDLQLVGRVDDSLYFQLQPKQKPATGALDTAPPGFRFDLPSESAVALPLVLAPKSGADSPPAPPGSLPAYPYFAFAEPGARLFPASLFSPALVVAQALRLRCRFEAALGWYRLVFDPLATDCTWVDCTDSNLHTLGVPDARHGPPGQQACCDSVAANDDIARNRALTLHYCETLLEWSDSLMRRRYSPEAFQQARLLCATAARIMGAHPPTIRLAATMNESPSVLDFKPAYAPLNPRLLDLYDLLADRLGALRSCMESRRLRVGAPGRSEPACNEAEIPGDWRKPGELCAADGEWCLPHSPYRFTFLVQKALALAGKTRELGGALQAAHEKGDAERLAAIHAEHEREMASLNLEVRKIQWREADWQVQVLQQTRNLHQTNLIYFNSLYQNGLINDEIQHQNLATTAMQTHTDSNVMRAEGQFMKVIADLFVGVPCNETQVPIGTKLAGVFETIAQVMTVFGDIQSQTAAIDLTLGGWVRRSVEWLHQTQTLPIEIEQAELQILAAHRRRDQTLRELNNQVRQIEDARDVLNFLRDKFTTESLFLWMQKETAALYRRIYDMALYAARQAERAFNLERGYTNRKFIPDVTWDSLHEGLLAGERLEVELHRMEKAYCDENVREYELTKHFSLRLHFPIAFLQLRLTGRCEIDVEEWMFAQDYPSHYMRRIRSVALTIPCTTGPFTGVHCRLALLSSRTRIDPRLSMPVQECCGHGSHRDGCRLCADERYVVRQDHACEAIATSSGQNDSGLLELNFHDDRYLPFEFRGAVGRWRIELPFENNYFDPDTVTEPAIKLFYTAREGGEMLGREAAACARHHLPGDGWRFFDLRHDFADAWHRFRESCIRERRGERRLRLRLGRTMFPYLPGHPELCISALVLVFETREHCLHGGHIVGYRAGSPDDDETCPCELHVRCVVLDNERPGLFHGEVLTPGLEPFVRDGEPRHVTFAFPEECADIERAFLLCRYEAHYPANDPCCRDEAHWFDLDRGRR